MSAIAGLLLPIVAAWGVLRWARLTGRKEPLFMVAPLAFGAGLGVASITTLLFITHGVGLRSRFVTLDLLIWATVAIVAWWRVLRRPSPAHADQDRSRPSTLDWLARAGFVAVLALVVAAQATEYARSPHGQWDAWAIWNQKARFLLRGGADDWRGMLSIPWANPGHPMLVSSSVARLWAYAGSESTLIPAVLAGLFAVAIAMVVIAALDPKRPQAWLAGALVLAPATFVHQVAAQTADLPLAFFVVVTLVKLRDYLSGRDAPELPGSLVVAGLFAGLAAWTKNEGLVLVVGASAVLLWAVLARRRVTDVGWWGTGLAIPVVTVLWYKVVVAPVAPEYMPATETVASVAGRLFDPARLAVILSEATGFLVRWGGPFAAGVLPVVIGVAVAASVPRRSTPLRYLLATLAIMFAGYVSLWVSAPFDASWLVTTTFDRLIVQLWPTFVIIAFGLAAPARR